MSFLPYPAYKDSGAEWLGGVPDHWIKTSIKHVVAINMGQSPSSDDCNIDGVGVPFLQGNGEFGLKYPTPKQYCPVARKIADAGDLLFSVRAPVGALNEADQIYGIGRGLCAVKAGMNISKKFLWHFLSSSQSFLESISTGSTFEAVSAEQVENIVMALPREMREQTQIARFLDHETASIDALIEEQQRLIELLKEKRQALISHAVTKGLDPMVPMKDSGVEWLGEVPAHWDVARVKNIAKLESGHTPSKEFPEYWEGGDIPWVSLNDSKQLKVVDYIDETQYMITALGMNNSSARLLPARAVVFTRDATIGLAAITSREMCVSQHLIAWICNEALMLPEYLLLVFYAMEEELGRFTFGATLKTIGMPDVRKLTTTVPPLTEQAEVVAEVSSKRGLISRLISEGEHGIALLQERRSALISAAVTGKIDVRGWQPPASAPIPELLQEAV